jgi:hypothetical protein
MEDDSEWASEPIAIIGMSCKFSGGANDPDKLWDLLVSGKTGWSEIPEDRFNLKGIYHPNNERVSTASQPRIYQQQVRVLKTEQTHVKGAHFLDGDIGCFDAAFFNYSGETAQALDPQFRMQLESTFEALENGEYILLTLLQFFRALLSNLSSIKPALQCSKWLDHRRPFLLASSRTNTTRVWRETKTSRRDSCQ